MEGVGVEGWRGGGVEGWRGGGMEGWRDGGVEGWRGGGVEGWRGGWVERWRDQGLQILLELFVRKKYQFIVPNSKILFDYLYVYLYIYSDVGRTSVNGGRSDVIDHRK